MELSKKRSIALGCMFVIGLLLVSMYVGNCSAITQSSSATSTPPFTSVMNSTDAAQLKIRAQAVDSMTSLLGFDTSEYNITLASDFLVSPQFAQAYDGLSPECVNYNLTSKDGNTVILGEQFIRRFHLLPFIIL